MKTLGKQKIREMYKEMGIKPNNEICLKRSQEKEINPRNIERDFIITSHTNIDTNDEGGKNAGLASN